MDVGLRANSQSGEYSVVPEKEMNTPVKDWSDDALIRLMKDLDAPEKLPEPEE